MAVDVIVALADRRGNGTTQLAIRSSPRWTDSGASTRWRPVSSTALLRPPTATGSCTAGCLATTCLASGQVQDVPEQEHDQGDRPVPGPAEPAVGPDQGADRHDQQVPGRRGLQPGRYIRLEPELTPNTEIRDFRSDLRACTDNAVSPGPTMTSTPSRSSCRSSGSSSGSRAARGRPTPTAVDPKVSPTCGTGSCSRPPSGGAPTTPNTSTTPTPAASPVARRKSSPTRCWPRARLPVQARWGAGRSRTFRFVVIDEAFGRGSDESTRYAPPAVRGARPAAALSSPRSRRSTSSSRTWLPSGSSTTRRPGTRGCGR